MSYEGLKKFGEKRRESFVPRKMEENFAVDPIYEPRDSYRNSQENRERLEKYSDYTSSFDNTEKNFKKTVADTAINTTVGAVGVILGFQGIPFLIQGSAGIVAGLSTFVASQGLPSLLGTIFGTVRSIAGVHFLVGLSLICLSGLMFRFVIKKLNRRV